MAVETLDLDESQISRSYSWDSDDEDELTEFARKRFRTYEESNNLKKIHTFRLCLESEWYGRSGLATKWTLKALKLGATDLTFRFIHYTNIPIQLDEVFASESVVSLRLQSLTIRRPKVIKCSALTSLSLSYLDIPTDLFFDIISGCPSIEHLSLSDVYNKKNSSDVCSGPQGGMSVSFHKLTSLVICKVGYELQTLLLDGLLCKFPNLKELTLRLYFYRRGAEKVKIISCPCLEILNFRVNNDEYYDEERKMMPRVEFDVPSLRKFTFEGAYLPKLSFRSTSPDPWEEFHVSLTRHGELSTLWFCELGDFLTKLSVSNIHLFLHVRNKDSFNYQVAEIKGSNVCEVEYLTLHTQGLPSLSYHALLDGLFRICRPKMISHYV